MDSLDFPESLHDMCQAILTTHTLEFCENKSEKGIWYSAADLHYLHKAMTRNNVLHEK